MYIGCARNLEEIDEAFMLAATTFRPQEEVADAANIKRVLMFQRGSLSEADVVVIVDESKRVIGTCFLIDRLFYRDNIRLKGTFLSSICINEPARGKGLSNLLMNYAIAECERRYSAFAILIARRAVDHFYNRFGFWGISAYSKISIKLEDVTVSKDGLIIRPVTEDDVILLEKIYETNYSFLLGACERSLENWKHILWKARWQGSSFVLFEKQDFVAGYAIYSGSEIYEIASAVGTSYLDLLSSLELKYSLNNFTIHASEHHPIVNELCHLDFSISNRQCSYGGHMVRVVDVDHLSDILRQDLQDYFVGAQSSEHALRTKDIDIEWLNGTVSINLNTSALSYENTCHLLGARYFSIEPGVQQFINLKPFNVPVIDQV
jgi:predicted acetyltransferase